MWNCRIWRSHNLRSVHETTADPRFERPASVPKGEVEERPAVLAGVAAQRAAQDPHHLNAHSILALQKSAGNGAVVGLLLEPKGKRRAAMHPLRATACGAGCGCGPCSEREADVRSSAPTSHHSQPEESGRGTAPAESDTEEANRLRTAGGSISPEVEETGRIPAAGHARAAAPAAANGADPPRAARPDEGFLIQVVDSDWSLTSEMEPPGISGTEDRPPPDEESREAAPLSRSREGGPGWGRDSYPPPTDVRGALADHERAHSKRNDEDASTTVPAARPEEGWFRGSEFGAVRARRGLRSMSVPSLKSGFRLQRRCGGGNGAPPAGPQNCVCCIENIRIVNVRNIASGQLYGHEFQTQFTLRYVPTQGAASDCTLRWMEKTNRGYTARMRAANNTWYDMTQDPETSGSFVAWAARTKPCPGNETSTDTDPPQASLSLPARTLEFRIIVNSGTGAACTRSTMCVTAKQTLAPNGATPPGIGTQTFETPNPSDAC